ncbi:hypothetical protein [Bacillus sp. PS06]|nr:hypothetical protein [Bacillus sp. PS06]
MNKDIPKQTDKAKKKPSITEIVKKLKEQGVNAQIIKKHQLLH